MNTSVNFEIAKLLKEKKFNSNTLCFYFEDGEFRQNEINDTYGDYGAEYTVEYSELTDNWNSDWVIKKDGSRCFGCNKDRGYFETFSAPTITEVIMWLYEKHGIWIGVEPRNEAKWKFNIYTKTVTTTNNIALAEHNSPTEAYSAAILYTLNNLI